MLEILKIGPNLSSTADDVAHLKIPFEFLVLRVISWNDVKRRLTRLSLINGTLLGLMVHLLKFELSTKIPSSGKNVTAGFLQCVTKQNFFTSSANENIFLI